MKIPGGRDVARSLADLKKALKACQRQVNQQAGKTLATGNYAGADSLVEIAKAVDAVRGEVDALSERWKEVTAARAAGRGPQTPMWEYYEPVVRALESLGGEAKCPDLAQAVEQDMNGRFQPGDMQVLSNGKPRWQRVVRRARSHMVQQGFLEAAGRDAWRVSTSRPSRRTR